MPSAAGGDWVRLEAAWVAPVNAPAGEDDVLLPEVPTEGVVTDGVGTEGTDGVVTDGVDTGPTGVGTVTDGVLTEGTDTLGRVIAPAPLEASSRAVRAAGRDLVRNRIIRDIPATTQLQRETCANLPNRDPSTSARKPHSGLGTD